MQGRIGSKTHRRKGAQAYSGNDSAGTQSSSLSHETANPADQWSFGDLFARVSSAENKPLDQIAPKYRPASSSQGNPAVIGSLDLLKIDDIARALDKKAASDVWQRYQGGERNAFHRGIYTPEGQASFDRISTRYTLDTSFREAVELYIRDFEKMLMKSSNSGSDAAATESYLTSDAGRVYLMLAHASGRFG